MNPMQWKRAERIAGMFLLVVTVIVSITFISTAVKQGWFDKKYYFKTSIESGEGVHPGTIVQMAGLRVGSVSSIELLSEGSVEVNFYILEKFRNNVRGDSHLFVSRPYVLGDKVLEVTVGSKNTQIIGENSFIPSGTSFDLLATFNNKNMGTIAEKLSQLFKSSEFLLEALTNKKRVQSLVSVIDKMDPLTTNLDKMSKEVYTLSRQATRNDGLGSMVASVNAFSKELNAFLPEIRKENPQMAKDLGNTVHNLSSVIRQLEPAISEVGPDMPKAGRELVNLLAETTLTLKALQKSFLIRGGVREVLEENALQRLPASEVTPKAELNPLKNK